MIWLTWRQFRASALVLAGAPWPRLAVVLAVTGPQLADLSDAAGERLLRPARAPIGVKTASSTPAPALVYAAARR